MSNYVPVKALKSDGDWFIVPITLVEDFNHLVDQFEQDEYPTELEDEFESKFGDMRTGGGINNIQLYIKA